MHLKHKRKPGMVAHAWNPSYLGDGDQEIIVGGILGKKEDPLSTKTVGHDDTHL
jgi:hypothetical protein